ncbi:hypothetical protein QAD02_017079 [Eretmocerus hayati]|uniref:Uncharacterized protein n=1 Tax=Eretmocerus hayati TaxID=131215 RepID=A0ACC2PD97_9HYME|nr:hypothetical protein QAD02_017079 [Eretmocerus hayati]
MRLRRRDSNTPQLVDMANSSDTETASGSLNNSQPMPNTTVPLNDQSDAQSTHTQFNSGNSQQLSAVGMIEGITRTAIECFCLGLNKELMPFMASKEPSTLEAAIGLAITYEKRNNQRRDLYAEQESQSRTGLKCTFCHTIEAGAGSRSEERPPDKISERSNPEAPPVPAVPIATVTPVRDMGSNQCYHCRGLDLAGDDMNYSLDLAGDDMNYSLDLAGDDMNYSLDLAGDDMNYSLDLAGDDMNYSLDLAGDDMNYSLDLAGDDMNCSLDLADDDLVLLRFRKIMTLIWNFSRFGIRIRDLLKAKFSLVDRRTWPGVMKTLKTQSCLQEKFDP